MGKFNSDEWKDSKEQRHGQVRKRDDVETEKQNAGRGEEKKSGRRVKGSPKNSQSKS